MKRIIVPGVLLLMGVTGEAMAACADAPGYTQTTDLTCLLPNNTVCDGSPGNWKGQEWHSGSSGQAKNLIDYKHGSSSANDPTAPIGEWSISGNTVTYGYYKDTNNPAAGTVNSSNKVWQKSDGTYDFCDSNTLQLVANVTIQAGQGACTGSHVPIACSAAPVVAPAQSTPTLRPTLRPRSQP